MSYLVASHGPCEKMQLSFRLAFLCQKLLASNDVPTGIRICTWDSCAALEGQMLACVFKDTVLTVFPLKMYQVSLVLFSQETVGKDKVTRWCPSLFSSAESPPFGHFEKFPNQSRLWCESALL